MSHLVPLGDTGWSLWRDVLLRSAGFPADGLDRFAAPEAAAAADAELDGSSADPGHFAKAFDTALHDGAAQASAIAADPLFREAVTWQNPGVLTSLDGLVAGGPDAPRNVRRRDREKALLRYWQRYCGKCETVGFFGPVCWATADPAASSSLRVGPGLVRDRAVVFEAWALIAWADRVARDLDVRCWWPPALPPHLCVDGRLLYRPTHPPVTELSTVDAAVLGRCDGRTPAREVVAGPELGLRSAEDGYLLLDNLVERGLLVWDAGLPLSPAAERVLAARIAAIGDEAARERVAAGFARLRAARDAVAAAGDPDALRIALAALDEEFTAATGQAAARNEGRMYAGRTLTYLDTTRDVDLVVGGGLVGALAEPLAIVLGAARWLSAELGAACERLAREVYADLAPQGPVRLSELWNPVHGQLADPVNGPVPGIAADFTARWTRLFGLDDLPAGQAEVRLDPAATAAAAARVFDAPAPGWPSARVHSADIQVCASDVDDLDRPGTRLVLGELHPAYNPFDSALFSPWHPDQDALAAAQLADFGPRFRLLHPEDTDRNTGRARFGLVGPGDVELGVAPARGANLDTTAPVTGVLVADRGGVLTAELPDGRSWPLVEAFGDLLTSVLLDSFKLVAPAGHSPRIVLGPLVVARRTWRTTVGATGLATVTGERERYLAVRRWRRELGLPERVFVKIGTETKPCYTDLTGPAYAQALCTMLRTAARSGPDVRVTVSEQLPSTPDSWLTDRDGRRYPSELRLQLTDPASYRGGSR